MKKKSRIVASFPTMFSAAAVMLLLIVCSCVPARAETLRKRYTFPYDRSTRRAASQIAANKARQQLLRDFLAAKFSPEITNRFAEQIDIALDPPDQFLVDFKVVSEKINDDETQVTLTVEGDFDFAEMVSALVQNKVLSFGKQPPRVMILASSHFQDPKAASTLRAMMYDKLKQAGLRPVASDGVAEALNLHLQDKIMPTALQRQTLIRTASQSGADYLIYIDTEVDAQPFSQGGYIADANFIHTILRPNGNTILGESIVSERGSGSSPMLAFDHALDSVAPVIAKVAIGQLFESIYSDSDVIYETPQLKDEQTVLLSYANPAIVQTVVERLQQTGAKVRLGSGMNGVAAQLNIETAMDNLDLFKWFNEQNFMINGRGFRTPVVAYTENALEVEAVGDKAKPQRVPIAQAPARRPRRTSVARTATAQVGSTVDGVVKAMTTINLRRSR